MVSWQLNFPPPLHHAGGCDWELVSNVHTVQLEERFLLDCYYIARKIEVISLFP